MKNPDNTIVDAEYYGLRSDNNFKQHPNGQELFYKWRTLKKNSTDDKVAKKLKCSKEALMNLRRRLDKKQLKRRQKVTATLRDQKVIEESYDLKNLKKDKDESESDYGYSLIEHIAQELEMIGANPTDEWMEILLYVSKYLFVNELSTYRKFQDKLLVESDMRNAASLANITDKKALRLQSMISEHIDQWGTLHTQAAAEHIDVQTDKINKLAKYVIENVPEKMVEVMDLMDGEQLQSEANDTLSAIMEGIDDE